VLYGVGARLDTKPELLFMLRGVDENELLSIAGQDVALNKAAPAAGKVLDDGDVAALFGLELAETAGSDTPIPATRKAPPRSKGLTPAKAPPKVRPKTRFKTKIAAANVGRLLRETRTESAERAAPPVVRKRRVGERVRVGRVR